MLPLLVAFFYPTNEMNNTEPKQAKTREARVEKYVQQILNGKGLND